MPNRKAISKTPQYTRLIIGDKMHILKMIKDYGKDDKNYVSPAAAIRHYVHLGIIAEMTTTDLGNTLDNYIVKKSQKDAVRDELTPLSNQIELLKKEIAAANEKNADFFRNINKRTTAVEDRIDAGFGAVITLLKKILNTGEYALKNLIVLRSIAYVFLLGHQTGKIESGKDNLLKWGRIINTAHEKANQLSEEEIRRLSTGIVESEKIKEMATEIFREVTVLPEAKQV